MAWIPPVTDRQQSDVDNRTAKGFCNYTDLNRLEGNSQVIADYLGVSISARNNWTREDFPTVSEQGRIAGNIAALSAAYPVSGSPAPPAAPLNTWQKWNAAETILLNIYNRYNRQISAVTRAGEAYSGEQIGVI